MRVHVCLFISAKHVSALLCAVCVFLVTCNWFVFITVHAFQCNVFSLCCCASRKALLCNNILVFIRYASGFPNAVVYYMFIYYIGVGKPRLVGCMRPVRSVYMTPTHTFSHYFINLY